MLGEADEGGEGLGDGALGEGEEMPEEECLRPKEGALLAKGGAVSQEQAPERVQKRRERRRRRGSGEGWYARA